MNNVMLPVCVLLVVAGCTTLQPVDAPREEVQRRIASESLLKPGDKVRLVTNDGLAHDLTVTNVDSARGVVAGADQSIPIADIASVEKRRFSALKTSLLAAGAFVGVGLLTAHCSDDCGSAPNYDGTCCP
jgi:hypothetical protein